MKTVLSPSKTKHSLKTYWMVTRSHGKLQKGRSRSKSTCVSKGAHCDSDREPSRLLWKKILNLFNKNKAIKRYVRSHIVHSVPHLSALKMILSFDYRNYLKTRMCRCKLKPVGITCAKGSRLYFAIDYVYLLKTRIAKDISSISCLS